MSCSSEPVDTEYIKPYDEVHNFVKTRYFQNK